jgi:Ca-activated chloride channel family protein
VVTGRTGDQVRYRQILCSSLFLLLGSSPLPAQTQKAAGQPYRVETALVSVPVVVSDEKGSFVPGLKPTDFKLYQDGVEQPFSLFATSDRPINIALMLDTSKSTVAVLGKIKKAAASFLSQLRPQDKAIVIGFDSEVQALSPLTSDQSRLRAAIGSAQVAYYEGTKLRDAILDVVGRRFQYLDERKAIILLTDGDDIGSQVPLADLLDAVANSGTVIYSVHYSIDPRQMMKKLFGVSSRLPREEIGAQTASAGPAASAGSQTEGLEFLTALSELSTGRVFPSDVAKLKGTFQKVADELRLQYLLGFYPDKSKHDGLVHELTVVVDRADTVVRSRRFYRAPVPSSP